MVNGLRQRILDSPKACYGTFMRQTTITTSSSQSGTTKGVYSRCDDTVGRRRSMNALYIDRFEHRVSDLNGKKPNASVPGWYTEIKNWVPFQGAGLGHIPIIGEPSEFTAGTAGLSRSRPDNPVVNVPLFLKELGDLPKMLRTAGYEVGNLSKNARKKRRRGLVKPDANLGNQYLNQVFGWDPLFRDLKKLLHFQSVTEAKAKELKNMYKSGGIRRRVELQGGSRHEADGNFAIFSGPSTLITRRIDKITTMRRWQVSRWIPTALPKDMSDAGLQKLAFSIAYGGRQNAADAWNAIPWSWLIDWYGSMGDYLNTNHNRTPLKLLYSCVMTTRSTVERVDYPIIPDGFTGGVGYRLLVTKTRNHFVPSALPTAHIPFLGGGQLAILGSLSASRRGK